MRKHIALSLCALLSTLCFASQAKCDVFLTTVGLKNGHVDKDSWITVFQWGLFSDVKLDAFCLRAGKTQMVMKTVSNDTFLLGTTLKIKSELKDQANCSGDTLSETTVTSKRDQKWTLKLQSDGTSTYWEEGISSGTQDGHAYIGSLSGKFSSFLDSGALSITTVKNPRNNSLEVLAIGTDHKIYHNSFNGSWNQWSQFGDKQVLSVVAIANERNSNTEVFALDPNGIIWHRTYDGVWGEWSHFTDGIRSDSLVVVSNPRNKNIELMSVTSQGTIYYASFDGSVWRSGLLSNSGRYIAVYAAVNEKNSNLEVFAIDGNHRVDHTYFDGQWHAFDSNFLDQKVHSLSFVTNPRNHNLEVFALNAERKYLHNYYDDRWQAWETRSGKSPENLYDIHAASNSKTQNIEVFGVDGQGNLYRTWFDGAWHNWFQEPAAPSMESVFPATNPNNGNLEVFAVGSGKNLYHTFFDSKWTSWQLAGSPVRFAVYGDMPYFVASQPNGSDPMTDDKALKDSVYPGIRKRDDVAFVLHLGDLGRPEQAPDPLTNKARSSCVPEFRQSTFMDWSTLGKPVFFTPGDNDWTDCARPNSKGTGSNPMSHLDSVRNILLPAPDARAFLNDKYQYESQALFPENQQWIYQNVLFVSINMAGSCNGLGEPIQQGTGLTRQALVDNRVNANMSWLQKAQSTIDSSSYLRGLVVMTHADLFDNDNKCQGQFQDGTGYRRIINQLNAMAVASDVKHVRVLLLHGDTDPHCMDQPFSSKNIWRLNAPGDFHAFDADVVTFDPDNGADPFKLDGIRFSTKVPTCS